VNRRERRSHLHRKQAAAQPHVVIQRKVMHGVAEFVWRYRVALHRTGKIHFELPFGEVLPPWFRVVLEMLRLRPTKWSIEEISPPGLGGIRYRVTWLWWLRCKSSRS
jgi:hypothetical protein